MNRNWLRYLTMALALLMVVMLASLIVPYIGL